MEILKFYQPGCAPCQRVENYLNDKGVNHTSIDVTKDPAKAVENDIGFGVPVVILKKDGEEILRTRGFNEEELEAIIDLYEFA